LATHKDTELTTGLVLNDYLSPTIRPEASQAMPSNWHSIHKNDLARAMVAQNGAGIPRDCARQRSQGTVKILEYKDMAPFFVMGESDGP
jgi:hypothetical protein